MAETRARIISATIDLIVSHGWAVSQRDLAKAAEVNQSTIWRIFGSGENLLRQTIITAGNANPIRPYLQSVLKRKELPPLSSTMCRIVELMMQPSHRKGICLMFLAALQQRDLVGDLRPDGPDTIDLLTQYAERLQKQRMLTQFMPPRDAALVLHSLILGSFCRNVVFKRENADADPVEAMRRACAGIAQIP